MKLFAICLILIVLSATTVFTQSNAYFTDDAYAKYTEYLTNSGELRLKYPLIQPYTISDLHSGLKTVSNNLTLSKFLQQEIDRYIFNPKDDPLRILKGEVNLNFTQTEIAKSRNSFKVSGLYPTGNFAIKTSFHFDQNFKDDSTYFGDKKEWYYGRIDEGYISYEDTSSGFSAFVGRVSRNLGSYSAPSLILSNNPYSFDHLWFQYQNDLFSFSLLTTRLEDQYGFDVRNQDSTSFGWYKRFYALHRIDINLLENLKIGLTEAIIYGGKNQQWLSYYSNPFVPYYLSKNNQRNSTDEGEANIYLALDIWYKPVKSVTLFTQIFIDDIDFKSENREKFPERKAVFGSLTLTDLVLPLSQLGLSVTWVEHWTYNSFYTWANYNIHDRGIGYPVNSYQKYEISFDYFGLSKFVLSSALSYSIKGQNSLRSPFPAQDWQNVQKNESKYFSILFNSIYFFTSSISVHFNLIYNIQPENNLDKNNFLSQLVLRFKV